MTAGDRLVRLTLPAELGSLERFTEFAHQGARQSGLPDADWDHLDLIIEEVLTNVMQYAYPIGQTGQVELAYTVDEPGALLVRVTDQGTPYNPLLKEAPDLDADLAHRPIGGLGIFLVRTLVESVDYQWEQGCNILTFRFRGGARTA